MDCKLQFRGSTSCFYKLSQGIVLKSPADQPTRADIIAAEFSVERQLLETLGQHPRIVRFVLILESPRFLQRCVYTVPAIF